MKPKTQLIRWPKCATERAILSVIANWHIAGILKDLLPQDAA